MATISAMSSGTYYGVTSDFFNTSSSTSSGTSYLSDFSNIKSGSYYKLMKAYYNGNSKISSVADPSSKASKSSTTAADKINAVSIRDEATALKKSSDALLETGSKSVFNKKTVKGTDGKETLQYDKDAISKAVSSFADKYNALITSAADSSNTSVLTATSSMVGNAKANASLLSDIGITIGSDNTLSIDKDKLKAADVSTIKSLFHGTGSYAYGVSSKSSSVYYQSVSQLAQLESGSSYSSSGNYNYNYTGSLFSSVL